MEFIMERTAANDDYLNKRENTMTGIAFEYDELANYKIIYGRGAIY